jgi:hypothetical protein
LQRREFIQAIVGSAIAGPFAAHPQQATMPVIGFLNGSSPEGYAPRVADLDFFLPSSVRGPVLSRALRRLASICRKEVILPPGEELASFRHFYSGPSADMPAVEVGGQIRTARAPVCR